MKLSLSRKFTLIMLGTVFLSAALSAFLISRSTRSVFMELVKENDVQTALILAENFTAYYERNGSWEGVEKAFEDISFGEQQAPMPGMMRGMSPNRMGPASRQPLPGQPQWGHRPPIRLLLTDNEGRVVLDNLENNVPARITRSVLEEGVPVPAGERIAGYIFVQSMIDPVMGPFLSGFLNRIYRSIVLSMLIVGVLAPLLGILLMRHITVPLRRLTAAAGEVARGSYTISQSDAVFDLQRSDEIGDLARSFQYMTGEIKAADEWKRALIADSAHELRTPVSLLQGNIEMMLEGIYPTDKEHLEMLHDETMVLNRLVKEMQDLANAEAGMTSYRFESLDIIELVHGVVQGNLPAADRKELSLRTITPAQKISVHADRQKFIQVLNNVLRNAMKYTPPKGKILIEMETDSAGSIILAVEDSGIGIPKEERDKIFQRFYRVDHDRNRGTGGSGLGLAIASEIVRNHSGDIRAVEPRQLQGARIEVEIPTIQEGPAGGEQYK
jgi:two-component system sensor histidine kinase BaeS